MPELPDVEGFRAELADHAAGNRITDVTVSDVSVIHGASGRAFAAALRGHAFAEPWRHGKWLISPVDGAEQPVVVWHFGMTGSLLWCPAGQQPHRHDRVRMRFDTGELRYRDMRKLKGITLTDGDGVRRLLADLGPDAYAIGWAEFERRLSGARRQAKAALTDQATLAGLGNLLADEILWRAGIHPRRRVDQLTRDDLRVLHRRTRATLRASIAAGRVPARRGWITSRRDDPGGHCPRCGTELEHYRTSGRSTVSCPKCQPE